MAVSPVTPDSSSPRAQRTQIEKRAQDQQAQARRLQEIQEDTVELSEEGRQNAERVRRSIQEQM